MFKYKAGWMKNLKGEKADIIVDPTPKSKALMFGGIGLISAGAFMLATVAFHAGATAREQAEFKTFEKLGLIHQDNPAYRDTYETSFDKG